MQKKKFTMHIDVDNFIPASDAEKEYLVQMRESSTFFKDGVKRLLKNKVATVCFFLIVIITLASILQQPGSLHLWHHRTGSEGRR